MGVEVLASRVVLKAHLVAAPHHLPCLALLGGVLSCVDCPQAVRVFLGACTCDDLLLTTTSVVGPHARKTVAPAMSVSVSSGARLTRTC